MDVRLPDGTIVTNVPDDITQEELSARLGLKKPIGTGEDVVRSALSAIPKGLAATLGLPGDVQKHAGGFAEFVASKIGGLAGIPEERFYGTGSRDSPFSIGPKFPTSDELLSPVASMLHKPETEAGKRVGGVVESVASASPLGKAMLIPGLMSGVGMEGMGMVSDDNPYLRAAGAIGAPGVAGLYQAYRSTPGQMVREATGKLTPQQIAEAQAKIAQARAMGIDLTAPEALPPSGIQQLMADTAASSSGGKVVNEFMARRPDQVRGAVERELLNKVGGAGTPDANMARARDAATGVISGAESFRTNAAKPYYQAARNESLKPQDIEAIIQRIDAALPYMDSESRVAAEAFKRSITETGTNTAALDKLYQTTRNKVELPEIGATPAQKIDAAALMPFNADLNQALKSSSQNIANGRKTYSQITEDIINPLTSGPVGRVAGRQGFDPSLPENLNPISAIANEKIARPESIKDLYTKLNAQDPQAFPGMARTWLENSFDAAQQTIQAGKNRMVGANFAKAIYGTPQQQENFAEVMRGVAAANGAKNPDAVAKGAQNLMEVLQLTGKVPGVGSPTGGRIAANEMASSSSAASIADSVSATPLRGVSRKLREWAMRGNYEALAKALTAPDSIAQLEKLGRYNPSTSTAQYFAAGVLGLNGSDQ